MQILKLFICFTFKNRCTNKKITESSVFSIIYLDFNTFFGEMTTFINWIRITCTGRQDAKDKNQQFNSFNHNTVTGNKRQLAKIIDPKTPNY